MNKGLISKVIHFGVCAAFSSVGFACDNAYDLASGLSSPDRAYDLTSFRGSITTSLSGDFTGEIGVADLLNSSVYEFSAFNNEQVIFTLDNTNSSWIVDVGGSQADPSINIDDERMLLDFSTPSEVSGVTILLRNAETLDVFQISQSNNVSDTNFVWVSDGNLTRSVEYGLDYDSVLSFVVNNEALGPELELSQSSISSSSTFVIYKDLGEVELSVSCTERATLAFDWSATSQDVVSSDSFEANPIEIDPTSLNEGLYDISVLVLDQLDSEYRYRLGNTAKVVETSPDLSNGADSDSDGVSDAVEGFGDEDGDRIPNYLDKESGLRVLQSGVSRSGVLKSSEGLLRLGDTAFAANQTGAEISVSTLRDFGGENGSPTSAVGDGDFLYLAGIFDFEVVELRSGRSVDVVIPLTASMPQNAVYRAFSSSLDWENFAENEFNLLRSAPGSLGDCPEAGSELYVAGLEEDSYCIQLTIEDGGSNDLDGLVNGAVSNRGGIAVDLPAPRITAFNNPLEILSFADDSGDNIVMSFDLVSDSEDAEIYQMTFDATGRFDESTEVSRAVLYLDANRNGVAELSEEIAVSRFPNTGNILTFNLPEVYQLALGSNSFLVTYEF